MRHTVDFFMVLKIKIPGFCYFVESHLSTRQGWGVGKFSGRGAGNKIMLTGGIRKFNISPGLTRQLNASFRPQRSGTPGIQKSSE